MGIVKIFYKDDCPMCPMAKKLKDNLLAQSVGVRYYNVETAEGLAEATFHRVMALPSVFVEDEMENEVGEWRGSVPLVDEVIRAVRGD